MSKICFPLRLTLCIFAIRICVYTISFYCMGVNWVFIYGRILDFKYKILSTVTPLSKPIYGVIKQFFLLFFPPMQFTGYDVGNDLIHGSGSTSTLFPCDGGQIRTEKMQIINGKCKSNLFSLKNICCVFLCAYLLKIHIICQV